MAEPKSEGSAPKVTCPSCCGCCGKRKDYLQWEEYFMSLAFLSGMRSKDPRTQVGACIVNDEKRIVGLGYNGMPDRVSDDEMFWAHSSEHKDQLKTKTHYVCHAELNAVLNKIQADCKKCTMYVSLFPCNRCAQVIIQAGIRNIVYYSDKYFDRPETKAAKMLFNKAEVNYRPYHEGFCREVNINFESINETGGKKTVNETAKTTGRNGIKVNSFFERCLILDL